DNIEYNGVMKAEHFGFFPTEGQITASFVSIQSNGFSPEETVLFTLKLKANTTTRLSQVLSMNSRRTPEEAYGLDDELMGIGLNFGHNSIENRARLYQNTPNPFSDQTAIGFYLPQANRAVLTIRDLRGALIFQSEGLYSKGKHQVVLKKEQLRHSGVFYYTLQTSDFTTSKKMILIAE
ncbi:MAG TPA: T9SS type A sorting domain-containing protein, partial [Haliscomenobacter sp.]|nr:T9SS type A sorting domain-containing protein [Haliscomenobacter sp.]